MTEESNGSSLTLWGEMEEAPAPPRPPKKPTPPKSEAEQPVMSPVPVPDTQLYPLATYNKILEILARLLGQFTDEMIAAGIQASTSQQAKDSARLADLWQRRLAKVREFAGKKGG